MNRFRVVAWVEDPWDARYDCLQDFVVSAENAEAACQQVREENSGVIIQCVSPEPS
jgi:hypothetical protein